MSQKTSYKRPSLCYSNKYKTYTTSTLPSSFNQTDFIPLQTSICQSCQQAMTIHLHIKEKQMLAMINNLQKLWIQDKNRLSKFSEQLVRLQEIEKQKQDFLIRISQLEYRIRQYESQFKDINKLQNEHPKQKSVYNLSILQKNMMLTSQLQKQVDTKALMLSEIQLLKINSLQSNCIPLMQFFSKIDNIVQSSIKQFYDIYS